MRSSGEKMGRGGEQLKGQQTKDKTFVFIYSKGSKESVQHLYEALPQLNFNAMFFILEL